MARIASLKPAGFNELQQQMFESITGGDRSDRPVEEFLNHEGGLSGPFHPWIHSPELGDPAQRLGAAVRFHSKLPAELRELAILVVGAQWKAEYEWWAHAKIAHDAGVPEAITNAMKLGQRPDFEASECDRHYELVYQFAFELAVEREVKDKTYRAAVKALGDAAVVDLVTTVGYYTLVAMTLNTFHIPLPNGVKKSFS